MTGEVLLTQGGNVMSGQKLTVDLTAGTGRMDGRVKTILQPSGN
jgi:lipopolysaccharide export system protein LptA